MCVGHFPDEPPSDAPSQDPLTANDEPVDGDTGAGPLQGLGIALACWAAIAAVLRLIV